MNSILNAKITNRSDDGKVISWTFPKINHYVVKKRLVGTNNWTQVETLSSEINEFDLSNLVKDTKLCEFRVVGVDIDGQEYPSGILAFWSKPPVFPKISSTIRNLKIGHKHSMDSSVHFTAQPEAEVVWTTLDDQPLPDSVQISTHLYNEPLSIFSTSLAVSSDEIFEKGIRSLKLKIRNDHGEDEATFPITFQKSVLPSAPSGPFEMISLEGGNVRLTWQPPINDGSPVATHFVIKRRSCKSSTWSFVARIEAAANPEYIAKNLHTGKYDFRIWAENEFGVSDRFISTRRDLNWEEFGRATVTIEDPHFVIDWAALKERICSPILHYDVERKQHGGPGWNKINTAPVKDTIYVDDQIVRKKRYAYRVVISFESGESVTSAESKTVALRAKKEKRKLNGDSNDGIDKNKRARTEPAVEVRVTNQEATSQANFQNVSESHPGRFVMVEKSNQRGGPGKWTITVSNTYFVIDWSELSEEVRSAALHYDVYRTMKGDNCWVKLNFGGPVKDTVYIDDQVVPGQRYGYRIDINCKSGKTIKTNQSKMVSLAESDKCKSNGESNEGNDKSKKIKTEPTVEDRDETSGTSTVTRTVKLEPLNHGTVNGDGSVAVKVENQEPTR